MPPTPGQFRRRTLRIVAWLAVCVTVWGGRSPLATAGDPAPVVPLFRVFLKDGTPLVSYGEYTRMGDRVVFTVPLGSASRPDGLQIVSLPLAALDWDRTTRYADTVRYQHYAATRGDADYTALTDEVVRAMSEMALSRDPARKLDVATRARARLNEWPRTHFGYRSGEVRDLILLLDEAISAAQAELGQSRFSFDLVAGVSPPPGIQLPEPSLRGAIESARAVARASDSPAERLSLQHAILAVLEARKVELPLTWASAIRADVRAEARVDARETRAYADIRARALRTATRHVFRGDVAGMERVLADVRARDSALGHRRADEVEALTVTLESHLDAARRRRLELDRWLYRTQSFSVYRSTVAGLTRRLDDVVRGMEAVRALSGPEPGRLPRLEARLVEVATALLRLGPPDELRDGHAALVSSVSLMTEAVRQRREAVRTADSRIAANASAAAAGALLLFSRAQSSISAYFERPGPR